jgi:hypothetical protein
MKQSKWQNENENSLIQNMSNSTRQKTQSPQQMKFPWQFKEKGERIPVTGCNRYKKYQPNEMYRYS